MKIFNWKQNKLNRRQGNKKPNSISVNYSQQEPRKEEFGDWPHGLLAIGTFGNNDMKEDCKHNNLHENQSSSQDYLQELTPEEVGALQNELNFLLQKQVGSSYDKESDTHNLAFDKLCNTPARSEEDEMKGDECSDESNNKDCCLQHGTGVLLSREKDMCVDNTRRTINKKSLSFLLKKLFVCRSGFTPTPSLRDQVSESRMDKILRAILHRKIYPQNPRAAVSKKRYLKDKHKPASGNEDEVNDKAEDGSKWVKTDSEYIVLEI